MQRLAGRGPLCGAHLSDGLHITRRQLLAAALASPLFLAPRASAAAPVYIADMHFHLFFFGPSPAPSRALAKEMAAGNVTLAAWSLVGDVPWLRPTGHGYKQRGTPKPGEPLAWFKEELGRIKAYLAKQNLKIVRTPQDVERALKGDPHVVLSVEGASFVEDDLSGLEVAYNLGIRHIQLVHYIGNPLADFQTEEPRHNGLSGLGREVVEECNRLGILVDLAHCTEAAVMQALKVSRVPLVWSHSSVTRTGKPHWTMGVGRARQLSLEAAKAIAGEGGVVGLWAMRSDVGSTIGAYADRLAEMADWLGEDHAGIGTDMNALKNPVIASFADLQRVVRHWQEQKMPESRIRKLAIGNYARVLRGAFAARQA
jgi:membrane dipeptidase